MVEITIKAQNIADLKLKMDHFLATEAPSKQMELPEQKPCPTYEQATSSIPELSIGGGKKPVKKKASKAKKAKEVIVDVEVVKELPPTREDATSALRDLNSLKGIEAAKAVLESFGCAKVRELPVEKYAEFIKACKK